MKKEKDLWRELKRIKSKIVWTRLENKALFGTPDLLGFAPSGTFFTVEMKYTLVYNLRFSPHQIAFHVKHPTNTFILVQPHASRTPILYPGAAIQELAACGLPLEACSLPLEAWDQLESLLLAA